MSLAQEYGFAFVQRLAEELSQGQVRLPSLPDVVVRVKAELGKEDYDVGRLSRIMATEPVLAGRIMAMSNSVVFRRDGPMVTELRTAITRLGGSVVRNAALSFAMVQLREAPEFRGLEALLAPQWERSTRLAALGYIVGRHSRKVNPDEAMLAGLVHNVGAIYILSRSDDYPLLFADEEESRALIHQWHPSVGRAILESWSLPAQVLEAVADQNTRDRDADEEVTLTDALVASLVLAPLEEDATEDAIAAAAAEAAVVRLGFTPDGVRRVVCEAAAEARELIAALAA